MLAATLATVVLLLDTGIYRSLFFGLILISVLSMLKYGWLWLFVPQEDLVVEQEIKESGKKMSLLSFALVLAFAFCLVFLFVSEWRSWLSVSIPLALWLGGELVISGIEYFQLCILEDELGR